MSSFHGPSADAYESKHTTQCNLDSVEMIDYPARSYFQSGGPHITSNDLHSASAHQNIRTRPSRTRKRPSFNQTDDIPNLLADVPTETLLTNVAAYAEECKLTNGMRYFQNGALVAQGITRIEDIRGLEEYEIYALHREKSHKWEQPKDFWLAIILSSLAAAVQGWDQTGTNGANLTWPQVFDVSTDWIVGLVNCAPYLTIFLFAGWISDPLNHWLGRRKVIFIAALFSLIAPIASGFTQNWGQLVAARVMLGVGMGLKEVTIPVYSSEIAPKNIRGAIVMSWQFFTACGILLGTVFNLAFFDMGDYAWRYQIGSAFIPAVPVLAGVLFCPESPRWLMSKGQHGKAYDSLCRLRNTPLQAAAEMYYIHYQMQNDTVVGHVINAAPGANMLTRFWELFTIPRLRRATQASSLVMLIQQMSGINIIAFYSSNIFNHSGWGYQSALIASLGFGAINVVFATPAFLLIDRIGRRKLLLLTLPFMFICLLLAGMFYMISSDPPTMDIHISLVATFIFVYAAFYSWGPGPVPFTYSAESFPQSHREIGMASAVATNNFWGTVVSLTFPRQVNVWNVPATFGFFAAMNIVAFMMVYLWLPETNHRSLEDLDHIFAKSTREHMRVKIEPLRSKMKVFQKEKQESRDWYNSDPDMSMA